MIAFAFYYVNLLILLKVDEIMVIKQIFDEPIMWEVYLSGGVYLYFNFNIIEKLMSF